jgi:hypothetical protein
MRKGAYISDGGKYRYTLWRIWDDTPNVGRVCFIGLNPSTADEDQDDPTIRRLIKFTEIWGYGGFIIVNLFALRSTTPLALLCDPDPVGPGNHNLIITKASYENMVVAMWGQNDLAKKYEQEIWQRLTQIHRQPYCFQRNKDGSPAHPLYLPYGLKPVLWTPKVMDDD